MYNSSVNKSEAIKISIQETKEQRKYQLARTYELKLQNLKNKDIEILNRLFLEAKSFCGHKQKISLSNRTFKCESCGAIIDRDINSARNMVLLGEETPLTNLPADCWEVTPVERKDSARILESNPHIRVSYTSMKQEALSFN